MKNATRSDGWLPSGKGGHIINRNLNKRKTIMITRTYNDNCQMCWSGCVFCMPDMYGQPPEAEGGSEDAPEKAYSRATDYIIVEVKHPKCTTALQELVTEKLGEGYTPTGGVTTWHDKLYGRCFTQAMVRS